MLSLQSISINSYQLHQYNNILFIRMKSTLGTKKPISKAPSLYQEYRSKTKSEINCSELLSGISELDNQMSKYEELRKQRLSQSFAMEPQEQFINMRSSMRIDRKVTFDFDEKGEDNLLYSPLVPITQYQQVKANKPVAIGIQSKSMIEARLNKDRQTQYGATMKSVEAEAKIKQEKKQKVNALKVKTKALQQQFLHLYSSDILKKSTINKQFVQLLKLLQ